jgi:hypothetical protein
MATGWLSGFRRLTACFIPALKNPAEAGNRAWKRREGRRMPPPALANQCLNPNRPTIARLQGTMRKEVAYWQAETSRARAYAAQIAKDAAARAEGWKRGRDDTIEIIPLIVSAHDRVPPRP